jgi:phosphoadenosine phosphosulfate reductase
LRKISNKNMNETLIKNLNEKIQSFSIENVIQYFISNYKRVALASSFGLEDQVLTHIIANSNLNVDIFTLDTGRIFPETYDLIQKTESKYKRRVEVYFPNHNEVEKMVKLKGINLFYESVENRKECCKIRKINPLKRALSNYDVWICGLRKEQSITRENLGLVEWDSLNNLLKINPLINWTEEEVWSFVEKNKVPYNVLHNKNYPSIGCQPCTRAIMKGEDIRAGRWWWENPTTKECGLHKK